MAHLLSIRRFGKTPLTGEDLLRFRSLTPQMLELLANAVRARLNIVVSGGTGSGKTTLLNVMSGFISAAERIVTIEDSAELQIKQEHVARLECRPANLEGKGAVRQRDLVVNALRMRPDRIILGEVRGEEAIDMLQAMNTGHDGSITTIHANSPRDAIGRIETMAMMGDLGLPEKAIRTQISPRRSTSSCRPRDCLTARAASLTSPRSPAPSARSSAFRTFFSTRRPGSPRLARRRAASLPRGWCPTFIERLKAAGIVVPPGMFEHSVEV